MSGWLWRIENQPCTKERVALYFADEYDGRSRLLVREPARYPAADWLRLPAQ